MTDVAANRRFAGVIPRTAPARATETTPRGALFWRAEDLLRWGITVGLGGIVIAVAWYICSGDATFGQQVGPADAAVAGLLVAGVGNATWLLKGRRALGERRRALLPDVAPPEATDVDLATEHQAPSLTTAETPAVAEAGLLVAGEGMERYHRADCALAAGRTGWKAMTRHQHESEGRRPCGVCQP
jgi:hypothetical protein